MRYGSSIEQLHPYLGYTYPPFGSDKDPANELGLRGISPLKSTAKFKVLVLGGSVASALTQQSSAFLKGCLAKHLGCGTDDVDVINGALGGYRQPQQLFVLTFMLSLGVKVNYVVNLDGFNEVALYPDEESWFRTHPIFPRNWRFRISPSFWHRVGKLSDRLDESLMPRRCTTCQTALRRLRQFLRRRASVGINRTRSSACSSVLATDFGSNSEMFDELAMLWARCSLLIANICRAHGMTYLHCLQPNQYLRSPDHAIPSTVYDAEHPYRRGVILGYPILLNQIPNLRREGVEFLDLSGCLDQMKLTDAYIDQCCHLSAAANQLLADCICSAITKTSRGLP